MALELWMLVVVEALNDFAKFALGFLVQIRNRDTSSQNSIVRMRSGHICGGFCSKIVELDGGNPLVHTSDNLCA